MKKKHYARYLQSLSENEEIDFKVISHLVDPGDFVVDVGANIGVYTKYLSDLVGSDGHVYAIEPIPLTFDILSHNVRKLELNNVELIACAISDSNSYVTMEIPLYKVGGENFYKARICHHDKSNSLRKVRVKSRTIDSLFQESHSNISFIKCDVEGHEINCIRGTINTIRKSQPAWLLEMVGDADDCRSNASAMYKMLKEHGYEGWWSDGGKLRNQECTVRSVNRFFLAPRHVRTLRERGVVA